MVKPGGVSLFQNYINYMYVRPEAQKLDSLPSHFMFKNYPFYRAFLANHIPFYRVAFLSGFGGLKKISSMHFFYE